MSISWTKSRQCVFTAVIIIAKLVISPIARSAPVDMVSEQHPASCQTHEDVLRALERVSDWDFTGHPGSWAGIPLVIDNPNGWNIRTVVDEPALAKYGIQFGDICPYYELRASGVSRRSSLRFILDSCGLAYYVEDAKLTFTTRHIARVKWLTQLDCPKPKSLMSDSVDDRRTAAFSAGYWNADAGVWVEPLARALSDSDRQVRFDAAFALGELGPEASKAIDPLISMLKSKDLTLREGAVFALGKIGPTAVEELLRVVDDPSSEIGIAGAKALDVMGSIGKPAVPELIAIAMRWSNDEDRCYQIAWAISRIDPGGTIPQLRGLLKHELPGIRAFAALTVGHVGPPGRVCAPDLLPLLTDQSTRVRFAAAFALAHVELPADFPTSELEKASKDPEMSVHLWASEALRVIKSKK